MKPVDEAAEHTDEAGGHIIKWGYQMNLYVALHDGALRNRFFPEEVMKRLHALGHVRMNERGHVLTETELAEDLAASEAEVCLMLSWQGSPRVTAAVLSRAPGLRLILSPGGSVASLVSDAVYEKNITVCSANDVMAKHVAEGTLAYMLAALREIPLADREVREGIWNSRESQSLTGAKIGLVGLGAVGRHLLTFLKPFDVEVSLYDPYVQPDSLAAHENVRLCSLEEALTGRDIVSVHASKTEETYRMINRARLALLRDGCLLVNTARGALLDEDALADELATGRIRAVLDVYDQEPLPIDSRLCGSDRVLLMPHAAGMARVEVFTMAMLDEIQRFRNNQPLRYEIPKRQFHLMTR